MFWVCKHKIFLYLREGEDSYCYVHGDLGKSIIECVGPCSCVHRFKNVYVLKIWNNKKYLKKTYVWTVYLCVLYIYAQLNANYL